MSFSNGRKISASPTSSSVQYTYSFSSWTNASGTVTGATTITANFSQSVNNYTVRFSSGNSAYGTVSTGSISVPYGTTYSVSGNTISFSNGTNVTANPNSATAQYTYSFSGWSSNNGTITGTTSLTANFAATVNTYTVSISGRVDVSTVVVEYGSTYSVSDNVLTITKPDGKTVKVTASTQYYIGTLFRMEFSGWSSNSGTIEGDTSITANYTKIKIENPDPILPGIWT